MKGLFILLTLSILTEAGIQKSGLPVPGAIAGMLVLLIWLVLRKRVDQHLADSANFMLAHLPLLLIPIGVIALSQIDPTNNALLLMILVSALSLLLAVVATIGILALLFKLSDHLQHKKPKNKHCHNHGQLSCKENLS